MVTWVLHLDFSYMALDNVAGHQYLFWILGCGLGYGTGITWDGSIGRFCRYSTLLEVDHE